VHESARLATSRSNGGMVVTLEHCRTRATAATGPRSSLSMMTSQTLH
jgi:hypothetical protein